MYVYIIVPSAILTDCKTRLKREEILCSQEISQRSPSQETHVRETSREAANSRLNGRHRRPRPSLYVTAAFYLHASPRTTHVRVNLRTSPSASVKLSLMILFSHVRPDESRESEGRRIEKIRA